jgi:hypothetical protein
MRSDASQNETEAHRAWRADEIDRSEYERRLADVRRRGNVEATAIEDIWWKVDTCVHNDVMPTDCFTPW